MKLIVVTNGKNKLNEEIKNISESISREIKELLFAKEY